jgi:hypothetical protein
MMMMMTSAGPGSSDRSPLRVAVVGHTNTGKTSLMRTLMRDVSFGEVSDRPAVTRIVQAAGLFAQGRKLIDLYDTPGLEDSIGLLEHLESMRGSRRIDGVDLIREFLHTQEAVAPFGQEAKALRQLLESNVALYVVDVRERVLGKHRDELTILGMCARPVVPVLNFIASDDARTADWREHLGRVNMHAVAEFDTVVYRADHEQRLFEKLRNLLDEHAETIDAIAADRRKHRSALLHSTCLLISEMLVDVAAHVRLVPAQSAKDAERTRVIESLRDDIRRREQRCVDDLLELHRFLRDAVAEEDLPLEEGRWGADLFSPEVLRQFGWHAGGAAAAGATIGLTLDAMLAGLSLGTGAAAGAAIGGVYGLARSHGRQIWERLRGRTELHADDVTLRLLAARGLWLSSALMRRGHAAVQPIRSKVDRSVLSIGRGQMGEEQALIQLLDRARAHPGWSGMSSMEEAIDGPDGAGERQPAAARSRVGWQTESPERQTLVSDVAGWLRKRLESELMGDRDEDSSVQK